MTGGTQAIAAKSRSQGFGRVLRKAVGLTEDERALALRLRRTGRTPWSAVARAVGRSVAELRSELDPTYRPGE